MKRFLAIFAGATILAGAASAANLRLYFSLDNPIPAGHAPLPAPAADGPSNGHALVVSRSVGARLNVPSEKGAQENPCYELAPGQTSGSARFHLWAKVEPSEDGNRWNGIALSVLVTNGGVLTEWTGLNVNAPTAARRWQTNSDFDGRNGTVNFVAVTTLGAQGPALDDGWDTGPSYDGGNDDTYMGYLEVTGPAGTEIFLRVGTAGITREGGSPQVDTVNFGWGDESVRGNQFGVASRLPDACIVPEPASLLLLGLGALALRRR